MKKAQSNIGIFVILIIAIVAGLVILAIYSEVTEPIRQQLTCESYPNAFCVESRDECEGTILAGEKCGGNMLCCVT